MTHAEQSPDFLDDYVPLDDFNLEQAGAAIERLAQELYVHNDSYEPSDCFMLAEKFCAFAHEYYRKNHKEQWKVEKLRLIAEGMKP